MARLMKSPILLRIASILTLVHAVLHTVGGVFGKTSPGAASVAVQAMQVNQFLVAGHMRNFWEFYRGLGLAVTILLTAEAVVFWFLASMAKAEPRRIVPILVTFSVAYGVFSLNSYEYFFWAPAVTEICIAACLSLAVLAAVRTEVSAPELEVAASR